MAELLKGKDVADALTAKLTDDVAGLKAKGVNPTLASLRVGERPDELADEKGAIKRAETVGVGVKSVVLPAEVSQTELIKSVEALNSDKTVHGVLMFSPLPKQLDEKAVRAVLAPEKDVDCLTEGSLGSVFTGSGKGFAPCTAQACIEILDHYGIDVTGKRAVVVGRSLVIGKPVAQLLIAKNATVTTCHTKTVDMPSVTRGAEIIIVAAGKAGAVTADYVSPGQTVIDVGINVNSEGKLCGDVDFASVEPIVGAITPVPGGVGSVTTCVLIKHVVDATKRQNP
jgi:methylenetetrahydrofolate dehydrogenase (NADP+)/methenyltetrahydrofolate cyclohydrolase